MTEARVTPVAVTGMACRLPGGITSPDLLWEALLRGDDLVTEVGADRWDADEFYDSEPGVYGRSVCKWGSFLDNIADFDPEFFGISEKEATAMDPQHRLLLQTSWEAMEHGGLTPDQMAGSRTSVFVGLMHGDYQFVHADAHTLEGPYGFVGNSFSMGSGRVAYALGLRGPAMTIDTACSSGLAAVHLACRSLHEQESDLALAGGASVMLEPRKAVSASALGMVSATGRCRAFDVAADGFVVGEGCVVLLLKRLPDALADADRVLAVIRGTAANQDGHTANIMTPSRHAQVAAYRAALAAADVTPDTVGMVEAHGPGTPMGDPVEYASLAEVYGIAGPCALGSVKTNFGHTQSTAGALGLMKAVLALQHGVIPRNLHFTRLPDDLTPIQTNLFVPQVTTPWPIDAPAPRRAAVSSYGISGTNVHAIVEQAPEIIAPDDALATPAVDGPLLFLLSATSAEGLRHTAGRLADWVEQRAGCMELPDLAYTLARRRGHRPVRAAVVADGVEELTDGLREVSDGDLPHQTAVGHDDRGPVWVFSGQGSQWAAMGAELLATEPVFAATVAAAEPLIAAESGFSVTDAMTAPQTVTGIDRVQPTIFAIQVALAATMRACGAPPGAVIGHSMGEAAAAVVAGALSLGDGARVICRRSRLMSTIAGSGAMASVELPALSVQTELTTRGINDVVVAVVTSPQSTVIGGATQTVRDLVTDWERRGVMAREVAVDVASHAPQVDPILDELIEVLADLQPVEPTVPYYSATLFDPYERPLCDAAYWADNLRHTVRFAAAVQAALEDGYRVFAEMAPHPLLIHAVEQTARSIDMPLAALAAMRRDQKLPHGLRGFLADLYSAGAAVDLSVLCPGGQLVDAPLPTWAHRRLLLARGEASPTVGGGTLAIHPLLGAHVRLPEEPERHIWQAQVGTAAQPWLADHRVRDVAVFPAAAYCEMALAAAGAVLGEASEVRDIRFEQALLPDEQATLGATASLVSSGVVDFLVETFHDGVHVRHAAAVLQAVPDEDQPLAHDMAAVSAAHSSRVEGEEIRTLFAEHGMHYGPAFAAVAAAHVAGGEFGTVLAELVVPGSIRSQQGAYGIHPALLGACFQAVIAHPEARAAANRGLLVPLGARRIRAYACARTARYCYLRATDTHGKVIETDLDVLDERGTVLLAVRGLQFGAGDSQDEIRDRVLNERLLTVEWQQRALPEADDGDAGTWLLISTSTTADVVATTLTDALKLHGTQCTTMCWPQHADHVANARRLRAQLAAGRFTGLVVLIGPKNGNPDEQCAVRGREHVQHLARIARELPDVAGPTPRLYVITRNAQTVLTNEGANLEQGGLRGTLRVIGTEYPHLRTAHIDVDEATRTEQLARQLLAGSDEDETAWRGDTWYTARLCSTPLRPGDRRTTIANHQQDGVRVHIRTPGDLETMELATSERITPGPGQIEVAVNASSINVADVLIAAGGYPGPEGHPPQLGSDYAGVVTAVGPGVTQHRVGDRVGGMSAEGCWGTFITCDARLAATLPAGLTDVQGAAVSTAYATAWYGLHGQARIAARDKVLIHSGTGGVGQAAIAIARTAGAEIFTTAGTAQRRQVLRDMGIEHVYDSRSTAFAELIRRDTDGYGVDIVLNSLPGAAQRAGLELLSVGGRFIEIGQGNYANNRLDLFPFHRNLTFHYVDPTLMSKARPERIGELLDTTYRLVAGGELPLPQTTCYPLAQAATALRAMSAAQHTGKLVIEMPHTGHSEVVIPPEQARVFRRDGSYVITGGLGGLGLVLAEKMAAAGCGRIVLTSRSQPTAEALGQIELIRAVGGDVIVECGDISEDGTAQRVVDAATFTGLPVRGVLHAAAVAEDATLANITDALIERNWAPKACGAWALHMATLGQPLDWFCCFSSAAALVGAPGHGAYAAANSWLDAFTRWRRAQGLPATAIAWGAWSGIGLVTAVTIDTAITADEGVYAFEALLRHDRAYTGYAPVTRTPWLTALVQRSPFAENFRAAGQTDRNKLLDELRALPVEEWPTRLRRLVSDQVGLILRRSVDPDRPLFEYGLDSLSNLELRTQIKAETGIGITSRDITTIQGMANLLCAKLTAQEAPSAPS